jgi:hypothetical protein
MPLVIQAAGACKLFPEKKPATTAWHSRMLVVFANVALQSEAEAIALFCWQLRRDGSAWWLCDSPRMSSLLDVMCRAPWAQTQHGCFVSVTVQPKQQMVQ